MLQQHQMYAYIPAVDLARARAFYEQKVGLKPKQEIGEGARAAARVGHRSPWIAATC